MFSRFLIAVVYLLSLTRASVLTLKQVQDAENERLHGRANDPVSVVKDMMSRVIPKIANQIDLQVISPPKPGVEMFQVTSSNGRVLIQGTSAISLSSGVNYYMRNILHVMYDWTIQNTSSFTFRDHLPVPEKPITRTRLVKYSYLFNVCTYGYTTAYWGWNEWESFIDWMALSGINLPLAFHGQEYVFLQVFKKLGLSLEDIQQFFGGSAFLPWARMGNIQGWGGPLTTSFMEAQFNLGLKILTRMRLFGMKPVLTGFSGHVPAALVKMYPNKKFTKSPRWGNFQEPYGSVYLLDALDPLFAQIGSSFIEMQTQLMGTDHIYNTDTFNEMNPTNDSLVYLKENSASVYGAMKKADSQAIWLMQGWLFLSGFWQIPRVQAYLSGVPNDGMIILDLASNSRPLWQKFSSYFGKPFIWNTLYNYGGQNGIGGHLNVFASGVGEAVAAKSTINGVGITMEGMGNTYINYDLTLANAWGAVTNVTEYVSQFAQARYGTDMISSNGRDVILSAWMDLMNTLYNGQGNGVGSAIHAEPSNWGNSNRPQTKFEKKIKMLEEGAAEQNARFAPKLSWNRQQTIDILKKFLNVSNELGMNDLFKYDVMDLTRQTLVDLFNEMYGSGFSPAYKAKELDKCQTLAAKLLSIIEATDKITGTNEYAMLGRWLKLAMAWSNGTDADAKLIRFNAFNQLTMWGPSRNINDYAAKMWNGLIGDYYLRRWSLAFEVALADLAQGIPFNNGAFGNLMYQKVDRPFSYNNTNDYPSEAVGDTIAIAKAVFAEFLV